LIIARKKGENFMRDGLVKNGMEALIISSLMKLPIISFYARTRGGYFIISLCHRMTGILLVFLFWLHLYCLGSIGASSPNSILFGFLGWILTLPIIFHAFNGGRLILYESFGKRNDETMVRWVLGLSLLYVVLLGVLMLMGNQRVSPFFFWLIMFVTALISGYGISIKIWNTRHSVFWKFQRISGALLLVMVPAYIFFIHLSPSSESEANMLIIGIQKIYIKAVYLILLASVLFHGGYGIWSVVSDYFYSRILRMVFAILVTLVMLISGWVGIRVALVS